MFLQNYLLEYFFQGLDEKFPSSVWKYAKSSKLFFRAAELWYFKIRSMPERSIKSMSFQENFPEISPDTQNTVFSNFPEVCRSKLD